MKKLLINFTLLLTSIGLTACSSTIFSPSGTTQTTTKTVKAGETGTPTPMEAPATVAGGSSIGSNIGSMDAIDKKKLSHALDKPLGKTTSWTNGGTDVTYIVIPIAKLTLNNNPYCRKYTVTATKGSNSRQINGTACVDSNSNWETIN